MCNAFHHLVLIWENSILHLFISLIKVTVSVKIRLDFSGLLATWQHYLIDTWSFSIINTLFSQKISEFLLDIPSRGSVQNRTLWPLKKEATAKENRMRDVATTVAIGYIQAAIGKALSAACSSSQIGSYLTGHIPSITLLMYEAQLSPRNTQGTWQSRAACTYASACLRVCVCASLCVCLHARVTEQLIFFLPVSNLHIIIIFYRPHSRRAPPPPFISPV